MEETTPLNVQQQQQHVNYKTELNNYRESTKFFCSNCQKVQDSVVKHQAGLWTFLCCGIWCLFSIIGGLIPFCCKPCKDVTQYCPECENKVGEAQFKPC